MLSAATADWGDAASFTRLAWAEDFSSAASLTRWNAEIDCWGGGNAQKQCYTDAADNLRVETEEPSYLVLQARPARPPARGDVARCTRDVGCDWPQNFTSARVNTRFGGGAGMLHGRLEVRARLPTGAHLLPAAFMLPVDPAYGAWPSSGLIDVFKRADALRRGIVYGEPCCGGAPPEREPPASVAPTPLPAGLRPEDEFLVYALEWTSGALSWYVGRDGCGQVACAASPTMAPLLTVPTDRRFNGSMYDAPGQPFGARAFELTLDLGVCGDDFDTPCDTSDLSWADAWAAPRLEVDYVRLWQPPNSSEPVPPVPLAPGLAVGSWELQGGTVRLAVAATATRAGDAVTLSAWVLDGSGTPLRMSVNDGNDFSWVRLAQPLSTASCAADSDGDGDVGTCWLARLGDGGQTLELLAGGGVYGDAAVALLRGAASNASDAGCDAGWPRSAAPLVFTRASAAPAATAVAELTPSPPAAAALAALGGAWQLVGGDASVVRLSVDGGVAIDMAELRAAAGLAAEAETEAAAAVDAALAAGLLPSRAWTDAASGVHFLLLPLPCGCDGEAGSGDAGSGIVDGYIEEDESDGGAARRNLDALPATSTGGAAAACVAIQYLPASYELRLAIPATLRCAATDDDDGGGYRGCPAGFPTAEAAPAVAIVDGSSGGSVLRLRLQRHYPPVNLSAIDWSALRWRGAVYVPQRPLASADDDADDFYSADSAASHVRDVRLARRLGATAILVQRASHRLSTHDEFLNATDGRATAAGALGAAALGGQEEGEIMAVVLEFSIEFDVYGNLREPVRQQRAVNDFYAFVSEHCSHRSVAAWLIGGAPNDPIAWTADLVPAFLGVIDALVAAACAAERAAGLPTCRPVWLGLADPRASCDAVAAAGALKGLTDAFGGVFEYRPCYTAAAALGDYVSQFAARPPPPEYAGAAVVEPLHVAGVVITVARARNCTIADLRSEVEPVIASGGAVAGAGAEDGGVEWVRRLELSVVVGVDSYNDNGYGDAAPSVYPPSTDASIGDAPGVVVADAPRRARFRRELAALAEGASELRAERGVDLGELCREPGCARLFAALDAQLRRERERASALRGWGALLLARLDPTDLDEKAADLEPRVEAYARAAAAVNEDDDVGRTSSAARSYRAQSSEGPPLAPPPLPAGLAAAPDGGEDGFARLARERTETTAAQATLEGLLRWAGVPRAVDDAAPLAAVWAGGRE